MTPPRNDRIRVRFDKWGPVRFTSARDMGRIWERSLRRSRLPVAYSEGFSPRPRLRFGLALATAHESAGEYLDVDLRPGSLPVDGDERRAHLDNIGAGLDETLPPGMSIQAVTTVEPGTPSLQEAVTSCEWLIQVPDLAPAAAEPAIERVMAAEELLVTRTRKGKDVTDDIRPAVLALRVADPDELPPEAAWPEAGSLLFAELGTQPRACRPAELLRGIEPTLEEGRVVRLHQWTTVDDDRAEPVPLERHAPVASTSLGEPATGHAPVGAATAPPAPVRAS